LLDGGDFAAFAERGLALKNQVLVMLAMTDPQLCCEPWAGEAASEATPRDFEPEAPKNEVEND
jgi:hypothetical protein